MKRHLSKQTIIAGILSCTVGMMGGCTSLSDEKSQSTTTEQVMATPQTICTPENKDACIVSYEDPDLSLSKAYVDYDSLAVSTNASYQMGSDPIALSTPIMATGLSVKDKIAQRELEQQKQDLALQPISSADIVCNGTACDKQLFKTEIEKAIQTTITEESVNKAVPSPSKRLAYGEEVHDWEAPIGETLRSLLMKWGEASGWTVVWKLDRDYHLEAGVVFRGKFTEVAAAFIRSFARATPAPIGTFYKGNRVLVINTQENENAD